MKKINLGIIGISNGNGHPYSWSAICNGYNPLEMENCGFPVIPRYLGKQNFPKDKIPYVQVTHVWAQDHNLMHQIAKSSLIPNVVENFTDMIGLVDGVLLARDDAENHVHYAMPFIQAGTPIYIDKPIALTRKDAELMFAAQHYSGQLFSCSALRYAKEFNLSENELKDIGKIQVIQAITPKNWDKYAVHVIEPALGLIPERGKIKKYQKLNLPNDGKLLSVSYENNISLQVSAMGNLSAPLSLRILGDLGWKDLYFQDSFSAFKSSLESFIYSIREKKTLIHENFTLEVVDIIEAGRK